MTDRARLIVLAFVLVMYPGMSVPIAQQSPYHSFCSSEEGHETSPPYCDQYYACDLPIFACQLNARTGEYDNYGFLGMCPTCALGFEPPPQPRSAPFAVVSSTVTNTLDGGSSSVDAFDTIHRVSVASGGAQAMSGGSISPALSADGRFIAFDSAATDLVAGDTNGVRDVFVHDRVLNQTERVSLATGGAQGNGHSLAADISADGRYVVFVSRSTNFAGAIGEGAVFVRDRQTASTQRISPAGESSWPNSITYDLAPYDYSILENHVVAISDDGSRVVYSSRKTRVACDELNVKLLDLLCHLPDVYVYDVNTSITTKITPVPLADPDVPWFSAYPRVAISGNGRFVAFDTKWKLLADDTNHQRDVYVHDSQTGVLSRVSIGTSGEQGNGYSGWPSISEDGRFVAFASESSNLVAGDTDARRDIFVRDRTSGTTTLIPQSASWEVAWDPTISNDGRWVAFAGPLLQIYLHDRETGTRTLVSRAPSMAAANSSSFGVAISNDARVFAFGSQATDLVAGDSNAQDDVFLFVRSAVPGVPPTVSAIGPQAGSMRGGTPVTISGLNFRAGATVTIGGVAATSVIVVNGTTITAVTGAHAAGATNVVVTNSDATTDTLESAFTFMLSPASFMADTDGDGMSDLAIFRPSDGTWFTRLSTTGYATHTQRSWGLRFDVPAAGDYDGDGRTDFAVYRPQTGAWHVLRSSTGYATSVTYALGSATDLPVPGYYDGDAKIDPAIYRPLTSTWSILASTSNHTTIVNRQWGSPGDVPVPGDYDGDSLTDLTVYRPSTGMWYVLTSESGQTASREFQWGLPGDRPVPGDYDGDGITDVAVYRPDTGQWFIRQSSTDFAASVSFQWGLSGDAPVPSDYDGDGKIDLAVFRPSLGTWYITHSTTSYTTSAQYQWGLSGDTPAPHAPIAYALAGRATLVTLARASDVDGDRRSDLTVFRSVSGTWFTRRSRDGFASSATVPWGLDGDVPTPHDYDGDGQSDFTVYRPSTGMWWSLLSASSYTTSTSRQWGLFGDLPVAGDFDGDSVGDPAVYRPSTGMWYVLKSSTNYTGSIELQWGLPGDVPIAGDFDGDAVSDLTVYRPSTGMWYTRYSRANYATSGSYQWGLDGDIAVPGEYDGDGKTDHAVFRPSTGMWYVLQSSTNHTAFSQHQWGLSGDTPVPGEYDGDGRTDVAVWRPSTGVWYLLKSSSSFTASDAVQWGLPGDIPILKRP